MKRMKAYVALMLTLAMLLSMFGCAAPAAAPAAPAAEPEAAPAAAEPTAPEGPAEEAPAEAVLTDEEAAAMVDSLIASIQVQARTDDTDAECAAAKAAWDSLTDAQKALEQHTQRSQTT